MYTMLAQRQRRCMNVIKMFCVSWDETLTQLSQGCATVADGEPTLIQHCVKVLCLRLVTGVSLVAWVNATLGQLYNSIGQRVVFANQANTVKETIHVT